MATSGGRVPCAVAYMSHRYNDGMGGGRRGEVRSPPQVGGTMCSSVHASPVQ